jgi:hypothetical protein
MKTILCILALLVLTASTADAYVRRTVGGGYVVCGACVYRKVKPGRSGDGVRPGSGTM